MWRRFRGIWGCRKYVVSLVLVFSLKVSSLKKLALARGLLELASSGRSQRRRGVLKVNCYRYRCRGTDAVRVVSNLALTRIFLCFQASNEIFLFAQAPSEKNLDWGKINVGVAPDVFKNIYDKAVKHYNDNVDKM